MMAKHALHLVFLALLALGSEAATSWNSLCRQNGKPTKFSGKLTYNGKNVGKCHWCFVDATSASQTGYARIRVSNVDNLRAVNFYTGDEAPLASRLTVTADTNITWTPVDTGNADIVSNLNTITNVAGLTYVNMNTNACRNLLYCGIVVGPSGTPGTKQPASLCTRTSGPGCN